MLAQIITSFVATTGFVILFNAPKNSLIKCGFVGMVGWVIYYWLVQKGNDPVPSSFVASFFIAFLSHLFARKYKMPVIIFIVGGIIPLVPGGLAYHAMRQFVINDYNMGIQLATKVMLIAGAIAMGIVFSEVFNQSYKNLKQRLSKIEE